MFEEDLLKINKELEEIKERYERIVDELIEINNNRYKIKRVVQRYQEEFDFENKERELNRVIWLNEKNEVNFQ